MASRLLRQPCGGGSMGVASIQIGGVRTSSARLSAVTPLCLSRQCRANLWSWNGPGTRPSSVLSSKTKKQSPMQFGVLKRNASLQPEKDDKLPGQVTSDLPAKKGLKGAVAASLKKLGAESHENIYTIPNILTATRLIAAPIVGYLVLHDQHAWALGLFAYAGITDAVDGWIARKWHLQTVVGTIIDPLADKMLMTILTVTLAMQGALPLWLAVIILGRDLGLSISAFYYRWISLPPPKTMSRYWDFSLPSAEIKPTTISKVNTMLQMGLIGATLTVPVVPFELGAVMMGFQALVATTTIWSGASYIYTKDAVKILYKDGKRVGEDKKVDEKLIEEKKQDEL